MCKYCDPTSKLERDELNLIEGQFEITHMEMFLTQSIDDESYWFLHILNYDKETNEEISEFSIPVNNCPMCGRLLNAKPVKTYEELLEREG